MNTRICALVLAAAAAAPGAAFAAAPQAKRPAAKPKTAAAATTAPKQTPRSQTAPASAPVEDDAVPSMDSGGSNGTQWSAPILPANLKIGDLMEYAPRNGSVVYSIGGLRLTDVRTEDVTFSTKRYELEFSEPATRTSVRGISPDAYGFYTMSEPLASEVRRLIPKYRNNEARVEFKFSLQPGTNTRFVHAGEILRINWYNDKGAVVDSVIAEAGSVR